MFVDLNEKARTVDGYYKNNFVEMPDPLGQCGKKIYISKALGNRFNELFGSINRNFNTLYFYKQMASLKNIGTMSGWVSQKTVLSRILPLEGGSIQYAIWHGKIYITQIQMQTDYQYEKGKRNIPAGLYSVKKESSTGEWSAAKGGEISDKAFVNTKNLAVNGRCADIDEAADYMPDFIQYGYGDGTLTDTYSLFFNPAYGKVKSGWRALRDSTGIADTQAAKKLADLLLLTGGKKREIQLTVHEQGHALLKSALRRVCQEQKTLGNVTVFYANPTSNLELLDRLRKQAGMQLAKKSPLINSVSIGQNIATGNFISGAMVASRADKGNAVSQIYNSAAFITSTAGLGSIASSMTPLGAAGWALGAAPLLLGSVGGMNKKVVTNPGEAVQEGLRSVKKLVWDPVHKMMVKA